MRSTAQLRRLRPSLMLATLLAVTVAIGSGCDDDTEKKRTGAFSLEEDGPLAKGARKSPKPAVEDKAESERPDFNEIPAPPVIVEDAKPARRAEKPAQVRQRPPMKPAVKLPPQAKTRRLVRATGEDKKPLMSIRKAAVSTAIENRKPVGESKRFSTSVDKLWAYVGVRNPNAESHITMVWKREGKAKSKVKLKIGKSANWRTWSSKRIKPNDTGKWSVDILDPNGHVLETVAFHLDAPAG